MSFSLPLRRLLRKTATALPSRGWLRSASSQSGGKYAGGIRQKSGESTAGNKSRRWAPSPVKGAVFLCTLASLAFFYYFFEKGDRLSYPTVDLARKVVIITGGNTGIGYETTKALAGMGAHTIIACRSEERATAALERLREEAAREFPDKQLNVEYMLVDLSSFQSVKRFLAAFKEKNLPLHILINNAGVAAMPYTLTEDGNEIHLQVNHLSHFLMTLELLPNILETASTSGDGRIVFVSSYMHSSADWNPTAPLNIPQQEYDSFSRLKAYSNTKLYNVLTAYALQRRLQNVGVTVSSLHPGLVDTGILRGYADRTIVNTLATISMTLLGRSSVDGAATTINCAVNPELNSQQALYYDSCRPIQSSSASRNEQFQEELWRMSVDMVKDHLSPETLEKYGLSNPTDRSQSEGDGEGSKSETVVTEQQTQAAGESKESDKGTERSRQPLNSN